MAGIITIRLQGRVYAALRGGQAFSGMLLYMKVKVAPPIRTGARQPHSGVYRIMDDGELDLFSFAAETRRERRTLNRAELNQLAFAFLCSLRPFAAARRVPVRGKRFAVNCAGFWRAESGRGRRVTKTAVVLMYDRLEECFADCSGHEAHLARIAELQLRREALEAKIRVEEPHLAETDDLFSDFRTYDYRRSSNREYHRIRRELALEARILGQGGRLARILEANAADLCYLAIPEGLMPSDAVLPTWGVVELGSDRTFRVLREPEVQRTVTPEGRLALALNVAGAAAADVRFASGIDACGGGKVRLRRPPRRRGHVRG